MGLVQDIQSAMIYLIVLQLLLCLDSSHSTKVSYTGYLALSITMDSSSQLDTLLHIREKYSEGHKREVIIFDDVILARRHSIRILVSPEVRSSVEQLLTENLIKFTTHSQDIQEMFDDDEELNKAQKIRYLGAPEERRKRIAPAYFLEYDEIQSLMKNWTELSDVPSETVEIGKTFEGRTILGIQINKDRTDLPAVWIDGGIDSRVWLSSATALYLISQLLFGTTVVSEKLRREYRWYVTPTINPDGYEYSRTVDRLWRKTRSTVDGRCFGVDMNRNFNISWSGRGSSPDPCADRYRGKEPFSEREVRDVTKSLKDIVSHVGSREKLIYFSLQGYGQIIQSPWSGQTMLKPTDFDLLHTVGRFGRIAANDVPEKHGLYKFGTAPDLKYPICGSLLDWVKESLRLNWTYAIDLTPELDSETFLVGPAVPSTLIYLAGRQTLHIIAAMLEEIQKGPVVDLIQLYGINVGGGEGVIKAEPIDGGQALQPDDTPSSVETPRTEL